MHSSPALKIADEDQYPQGQQVCVHGARGVFVLQTLVAPRLNDRAGHVLCSCKASSKSAARKNAADPCTKKGKISEISRQAPNTYFAPAAAGFITKNVCCACANASRVMYVQISVRTLPKPDGLEEALSMGTSRESRDQPTSAEVSPQTRLPNFHQNLHEFSSDIVRDCSSSSSKQQTAAVYARL